MPSLRTLAFCCLFAPLFTMGALPASAAPQNGHTMTTPSGLQITDTQIGTGAVPASGQTVAVDYTGWLYVDGKKGAKFDSSLDRWAKDASSRVGTKALPPCMSAASAR